MSRITATDLRDLQADLDMVTAAVAVDPIVARAKTFDEDDFRDGFILKALRYQRVLVDRAAHGIATTPITGIWGAGR